jgi:hypothetical protein
LLGSYTVKVGDTVTEVTAGLLANVNLNTATTQWQATEALGVITLVPPAGLGEALNGDVITTSSATGTTFASTITAFVDGVGSPINTMHYTLKTYFNANPTAKVYIAVYDFTSAYDASKLAGVQTFAEGEIRQMGVLLNKELDSIVSLVTATQAEVADQTTKHKPFSVVLGITDPGTIGSATDVIDVRSLASRQVSVTISNEFGATTPGYKLKGSTGKYPTDLGALLGHISRSKVSHSIAWVERNLTQFTDTMLITGEKWQAIEDTVIPQELKNKGYIFERKYLGFSGSYFDNEAVADSFTSDYDSVKRSRVIDKAARVAYTTLVPFLSSPIVLNPSTGTMSTSTVITFAQALKSQLDSMFNNGEFSGYSVYIDPSQNILVTKELQVTVDIVPIGSADTITVNLGYALSLQ